MSKREFAEFNLLKGDLLIRAHIASNSLSGTFDSYDSATDLFTFLPTGAKRLKSEYLSDIKAIIRTEG